MRKLDQDDNRRININIYINTHYSSYRDGTNMYMTEDCKDVNLSKEDEDAEDNEEEDAEDDGEG